MWSNYRPTRCMWLATAFSVARGNIQKKPSNLKFVEVCEVIFVKINIQGTAFCYGT